MNHPSNFLWRDVKYESQSGKLKASLSNLANVYWSTYKITKKTLEKDRILKRLRSNKDMVITRPDKGNGLVVLDKKILWTENFKTD